MHENAIIMSRVLARRLGGCAVCNEGNGVVFTVWLSQSRFVEVNARAELVSDLFTLAQYVSNVVQLEYVMYGGAKA